MSEKAIATINLRIHPRDSIESVLKHVGDLFDKDPWVGVEIASMGRSRNPSPVSSTTTEGYKAIERTIREVFPDTIVAPSLVVVGTDSRHFSEVADAVYRFGPFSLNREDLKRIHGGDERVRIEDLANAVSFYMQLMDNL